MFKNADRDYKLELKRRGGKAGIRGHWYLGRG
jgi:hypothetical protein